MKLAAKELESLEEGSRPHLQKLVYTNLVDRFDVMIDKTILDNCLEPLLLDESLSKLDSPVTESQVLKLLMDGGNVEDVVRARVRTVLSNGILRQRHSKKLSKVFELFRVEKVWNEPKVNDANGKILLTFKPQRKTVPASVCGYADWLYSRRNAIVHGGGTSNMLDNDVLQIEKTFKIKVVKTTKIKLGAINTTSNFYLDVLSLLKKNITKLS